MQSYTPYSMSLSILYWYIIAKIDKVIKEF